MKYEECRIGENIRVTKGSYAGKESTINSMADKDVRFSIGAKMPNGLLTTWFEPDALEKI